MISYRTVERLYSDLLETNNLFIETLRWKSIGNSEAEGDGRGYSLEVTNHHRSMSERYVESVKNS